MARKPSKYEQVVKGLPAAPISDLAYQGKVETVKLEVLRDSSMLHAMIAETLDFGKKFSTIVTRAQLVAAAENQPTETHTPESLVRLYSMSRKIKEILEDVLYEAQQRVTALEQMLVKSHEQDEMGWGLYGAAPSTVRVADGSGVQVNYEPGGKVVNKDEFRQWCIDNGYGGELQLWPSKMNSIVKERLVAGEPTPAGVEAHSYAKVRYLRPSED